MGWQKSTNEALLALAGQKGGTNIADTDTHTGTWWKIIVITAATFTTNTLESGAAAAFSGSAVPAGVELLGNFTAIDLASGHVYAVKY